MALEIEPPMLQLTYNHNDGELSTDFAVATAYFSEICEQMSDISATISKYQTSITEDQPTECDFISISFSSLDNEVTLLLFPLIISCSLCIFWMYLRLQIYIKE